MLTAEVRHPEFNSGSGKLGPFLIWVKTNYNIL